MHVEDAQLVQRCLEGDTDAFGKLVESYQGAVFATAYYYAGRYGAAEDIAQDAFLEAYRNLRNLRDPNRFGPWLKELTCRTSANWLRKHGKRLQNETPLPYRRTISIEDARLGPEQLSERNEKIERINRAIDALPERYRLPVVLRYLQELSYHEISEFTGESKDEIRGVLERASRLMRDILEGRSSEEQDTWRRVRE
ncbi:MAG: RNA polymerase sigma factor [Candidatus Hydrogenedentota bacterium]